MNFKTFKLLSILALILAVSIGVSAQDATPEATPEANSETMSMGGETQATIQEIVDNPDGYVGTTVTMSGIVSELVNVRSFLLTEDAALGADSVLVVNNSGQTFPLNLTADQRYLVTGTVHPFDRGEAAPGADWQNDYYDDQQVENLGLHERALDEYVDYQVIEITNVNNLVPIIPLQNLASGAEPYNDNTVYAVEGYVNEILNDYSFIIGEGAALGNAQAIVFGPSTGDMTNNENDVALSDIAVDQYVRIYGTVSQLGGEDFVEDYNTWGENYGYGYDETYDTDLFGGYEADAWEAVFANAIIPIPEP